jgi:hypothetical protein
MKRDYRLRFRLVWISAGILAFLIFLALAASSEMVERGYASRISPVLVSLLSRLTGWIPFSLAELFLAGFLFRQIRGIAWGVSMIRVREWRPRHALAMGALRLGSDLGILVLLFYVVWGFNYARSPLEERRGWNVSEAAADELVDLALEMIEAANAEYVALHEAEDVGFPTGKILKRPELVDELEKGWAAAGRILGEPWLGSKYGPPKPFLASRLLDYLGISGIYFPWTGEANINRGTPPVSLPQVFAHEMSHQRGYAREDEASFTGYLAASLSSHPYARYSAAVFAQRQLITGLALLDRDKALALVERRHGGVQRDIDAANAYWARFAGPAQRAAERVNDAYLKSQQVPGGIRSYGRSVALLVAYARTRSGSLPHGGAVPR